MKILIFSRSYKNMAGGIERKSLEIAAGLEKLGHEIHVVSLDAFEDLAFYDWPTTIKWHKANIGNPSRKAGVSERLRRVLYIRNLLRQDFDIAVGFQIGAYALLKISSLGLKVGLIAAERNAPTLYTYLRFGKIKRYFSNLILLTSSNVTILFPEFRKYYPKYLHKKLVITPNWVELSKDDSRDQKTRYKNQILFVGRFSYQKNLNCLLEAAALIEKETEIILIGSGDDLESAKAKAASLNLNCKFLSPTRNLIPYYKEASLLCLPSLWEGFPNVAAEALAAGLPVVGFSECAGLRELVIPGKSGELAIGNNDKNSLSVALKVALNTKYSEEIMKASVTKYTYSNFISSWEHACKISLRKKPYC